MARTARAARPLVERCIVEHEVLLRDAGIEAMLRRTGYLKLSRHQRDVDGWWRAMPPTRSATGSTIRALDAKAVEALEPHFTERFAGGVHIPDPVSVADPGAVGKAYAEMFAAKGGGFRRGDARTLERDNDGNWVVQTEGGPVRGKSAVVALGPWSDDMLRKFGFRIPLGSKRGYHMHFRPRGNATLNRPILDADHGYALTAMNRGIRLTTGAEFARRDAAPTPVQLDRVEPTARSIFPLEQRLDAEPWLGRRPCLPDMLPAIGPVPGMPGLWANFGHHHLGFTLGPVSGRLIAEMMTGESPFTDPTPYRPERFA